MQSKASLPLNTAIAASLLVASLASIPTARADRDEGTGFRARLSGFNEVHFIGGATPALRGAVSTTGRGSFKARLIPNSTTIEYELGYRDLEGSVTQSHIHFGQHHTVGGITVWLCQTATNPAPAAVAAVTPQCPASGTVTGMIGPGQVLAVTGQGLEAGEFDSLVRALRAGATYVNVHSSLFPPGEIRGQVESRDD